MKTSSSNRSDGVLVIFLFLFWVVLCNGQISDFGAPMEKTEQEALYSAIQGFVGDWWNGSDLFPDPCGWTPIQGVSCDLFDGFWYVTDLNIGPILDNSLQCSSKPQFTPSLFMLKHLKSLLFSNCFVSTGSNSIPIPTGNWENLSGSLESLEFRSNPGLTGQIPAAFGNLSQLRSLVLLENGINGQLPRNVGALMKLRRLVFAGSGFSGRIPDTFGGLRDLLILDLSNNSLSGPIPTSFRDLDSIMKLDLSNNQLEGEIPYEIANLKKLTLLDLRKNELSGGLTQSLQELSSLEQLVLSNNPIGGELGALEWRNLIGLVILDLSNTSLTGGVPDSISELKSLRFLGLNDNKLTGNISPKLESLPNISAIYLNGNNLTGELKFSKGFYGKMGRRFGVWNNTKLCYPDGLMSTKKIPLGVRSCQEVYGYDPDSTAEMGEDNPNRKSQFTASFGSLSRSVNGIRCVSLVVATIVMMFL